MLQFICWILPNLFPGKIVLDTYDTLNIHFFLNFNFKVFKLTLIFCSRYKNCFNRYLNIHITRKRDFPSIMSKLSLESPSCGVDIKRVKVIDNFLFVKNIIINCIDFTDFLLILISFENTDRPVQKKCLFYLTPNTKYVQVNQFFFNIYKNASNC